MSPTAAVSGKGVVAARDPAAWRDAGTAGVILLPVIAPSSAEPAPATPQRWGYVLSVLVLLASLALVLASWRAARDRELRAAEADFRGSANAMIGEVQQRLDQYELITRGGVSLFSALNWPSPQQWNSFTDGLSERYPEIVGLGFAAGVDRNQLGRLQQFQRDAGNGLFEIRPRGIRDFYGPILYLEPHTPQNLQAIGYDMFVEPSRQAAMRIARDEARSRMTGRVTLLQDAGSAEVVGLLLYTPVYTGNTVPAAAAARRSAFRGWVYLPLRVAPMVAAALAGQKWQARLKLLDITDASPQVLYEDPRLRGEGDGGFAWTEERSLYGRIWRYEVRSGPVALATPQLATLRAALVTGVVASLLLFGIALSLAWTQSRAHRIAGRMTESYARSERRFRAAMEYSAIGKALLDASGRIVEVNPAFARIAGRPSAAVVGLPFASLLDGGSESLKTSEMSVVEGTEDVFRSTQVLRRPGGDARHVQLTFAPVPGEIGQDIARLVQMEDVTDRVRAQARVLALNRSLESQVAERTRELSDANRDLESFASSVSHDLRAPLRAMSGFAKALGERHADQLDEAGLQYVRRIRDASVRMGQLIDALLRLSRPGRAALKLEEVDLSALAEEIAAALREQEPERQVQLRIEPGMRAWGDATLLRNLLENVIGNAWKFTRDSSPARIEVGTTLAADGERRYYVQDNGAGFEQAYADKLFRPFQRLHSERDFAGHGIGLASVKRIVERHGGEITAHGTPGQGARFEFSLRTQPEG